MLAVKNVLGSVENPIVDERIAYEVLEERLSTDLKAGNLRSEQWFRNSLLWYKLAVSYNNPYNHRHVHSELFLLHEHKHELMQYFDDALLVFYGVGVGDTEIEVVDWVLSSRKYAELVGIDVNMDFIDAFISGLRNKCFEDDEYKVMFKAYNALFDQVSATDFAFENSRCTKKVHICLGNTIGNFSDQHAVFQMFSDNCLPEDLLVLGIQLDTDIDTLLRKYSQSLRFARFIMNCMPDADVSQLMWCVDDNAVKAFYHEKEVFRSKKYDADELSSEIAAYGFKVKAQVIDEYKNSCVQVYERR